MTNQLLLEAPLPGTSEHDAEIERRTKMFEQVVDNYSTNRKDRRKFKKMFGVMPPAKNLPYVKNTPTVF